MKGSVSKGAASCLLAVLILAGLAAACSEVRPEPDADQSGVLESPTHEADALRRSEERQEQNRGGGGGGGGY